ncbi:TPA: hypothetical protein O1880_002621 [Staphylococcus aureus]|uniref:hypothetical protein n=1 Tax=Staphylococcus aureus TaxID=1280 RepID=UPI000DA7ABAE|nr:hypothetical protein [Staphylococcus aureus]PZK24826.1 hypothetical protein C7Q70_14215 [Staphylococcus aureus]HCY8173564.1 hypothetical protein [Staphylococcus aureus]
MFLDIVIDSDSIKGLFNVIFNFILVFIAIFPILFGFYASFINAVKYDNYETARTLSIVSGLLLAIYMGVYFLLTHIFNIDIGLLTFK